MNKKLVALLLSSVMAAGLAGCGSSENVQTAPSASAQAPQTEAAQTAGSEGGYTTDSITINIWDSNQQAGLQTIADDWTATSGVKVNIEVIDWDNYWTLLEAGASGGEMPDVFWMHSNTAQMYMENDILLDLTDYIAADDSVNKDNFYEGVWNLYSSDGKQYALPKDHDTIALLYNKSVFDKYVVDYPTDDWTWDDMY